VREGAARRLRAQAGARERTGSSPCARPTAAPNKMSARLHPRPLTRLALLVCVLVHPAWGRRGVFEALAQEKRQAPANDDAQRSARDDSSDLATGVALCNKGDAKACNVVGAMYATGLHGIKLDPGQAFAFFRKACDLGHPIGCANLANQYYNGLGVTVDQPRAVQIYQRSCDLGAVTGCVDLGVIYRDGKGAQAKNPEHAAQLLQRACDLSAAACASIASMYELGIGVTKDIARARSLYERSCYATRSDAAEDIQKVWSNAACNVLSRMK